MIWDTFILEHDEYVPKHHRSHSDLFSEIDVFAESPYLDDDDSILTQKDDTIAIHTEGMLVVHHVGCIVCVCKNLTRNKKGITSI